MELDSFSYSQSYVRSNQSKGEDFKWSYNDDQVLPRSSAILQPFFVIQHRSTLGKIYFSSFQQLFLFIFIKQETNLFARIFFNLFSTN